MKLRFVISVCVGFWLATGLIAEARREYPPEVRKVIDQAGSNGSQLRQVLDHYQQSGDTLRYKAVCFLIANMADKGYVTYSLVDSTGDTVPFDVKLFPDYQTMKDSVRALEQRSGELDFRKNELIPDIRTIKADYLIGQVDEAFAVWRDRPWARGLTFDLFCEYVLPYRGSNEPVEAWRREFQERYRASLDSMQDETDPIAVARVINNEIRGWFKFDPRYYYHPTDQGLAEMLANKRGRCEDMTNVTIYAMRANGLAVTSDYTPYWANTGNNHAWNAIVTGDGRVIPFMGAEANPGEYHLSNKLAKVYRKTFSARHENLAFVSHKQAEVPRWLKRPDYADVTSDYVEVCDVSVRFERTVPDSVDIAYLCVFNSGEWKAIHWGRVAGDSAVFTDMGRGIAYLPALYLNKQIVPWGDPFILSSSCDQRRLQADTSATASLRVISTTTRRQAASTDGVQKTYLKPDQAYDLYYWQDGWQPGGEKTATGQPLWFERVPSKALYWLVEEDSDRESERIFTVEDGHQVWW